MTLTYARYPHGESAEVGEPFNHVSDISTIGSLSLSGVGPTMIVEGAVDTLVFDAYVEKFPVPSLLPGDIALLDNVKFHYSERSINMIEVAGAGVRRLPNTRRISPRSMNSFQRSKRGYVKPKLAARADSSTLWREPLRRSPLMI